LRRRLALAISRPVTPRAPPGLPRRAPGCTPTPLAPTVMRAGSKTNVMPDRVEL